MSTAKIAISIEDTLLKKLDNHIAHHAFKNRSQAIQMAVINIIFTSSGFFNVISFLDSSQNYS